MAKIKLPERLLILNELPLSNFGKVSKKKLSEMAAIARGVAAESGAAVACVRSTFTPIRARRNGSPARVPMSSRWRPTGSASGSQKPKPHVIAEFEAAGVDTCLVALDLSTTIGNAAVQQ